MAYQVFFLLCALSVVHAQFPVDWILANYTGTSKMSIGGEYKIKGWTASHFDQAKGMSKSHALAQIEIGGQTMSSESWSFSRAGVIESYSLVSGQCQHNRQTVDVNTFKECMQFTWSDSVFQGQPAALAKAVCKIHDNATGTDVEMENSAFFTTDKKTPIGAISVVKTSAFTSTTEMAFTNVVTSPLPDSYFTLPAICRGGLVAVVKRSEAFPLLANILLPFLELQ